MTNFENIKNMDIEEMAIWIYTSFSENEDYETVVNGYVMLSEDDVKNWLKDEVGRFDRMDEYTGYKLCPNCHKFSIADEYNRDLYYTLNYYPVCGSKLTK